MVDRFPNYIHATVTQPSADAFGTLAIPTPRSSVAGGTIVKELLWIDFNFAGVTLNAGGESVIMQLVQGTTPTAILTFDDSQVIAQKNLIMRLLTSGAVLTTDPYRFDLQGKAGFGFLFAGETLHLSVDSTATGVASTLQAKIAYRDVRVTIEELNGLVISLLGG